MNRQTQTHHTASPRRRWNDHSGIDLRNMPAPVVVDRLPAHVPREHEAVEIRNTTGKAARGVEIELTGFGESDVFQAYYLNRGGAPRVTRTSALIRVCFESLCRTPKQSLSHSTKVQTRASTRASQLFVWELALFGGGGSDRFCLELSTLDISATYRWLISTNESAETLVTYEVPVLVHNSRAALSIPAQAGA